MARLIVEAVEVHASVFVQIQTVPLHGEVRPAVHRATGNLRVERVGLFPRQTHVRHVVWATDQSGTITSYLVIIIF